jgi:hypothetical protein
MNAPARDLQGTRSAHWLRLRSVTVRFRQARVSAKSLCKLRPGRPELARKERRAEARDQMWLTHQTAPKPPRKEGAAPLAAKSYLCVQLQAPERYPTLCYLHAPPFSK